MLVTLTIIVQPRRAAVRRAAALLENETKTPDIYPLFLMPMFF